MGKMVNTEKFSVRGDYQQLLVRSINTPCVRVNYFIDRLTTLDFSLCEEP